MARWSLTWSVACELSDEQLERRLYPSTRPKQPKARVPVDFAVVHRELRRKGVTLMLLWVEHCEAAKTDPQGRQPYQYSQFCNLYRAFRKTVDVTMPARSSSSAACPSSPLAMRGQPCDCTGVGPSKLWVNHVRVGGLKESTGIVSWRAGGARFKRRRETADSTVSGRGRPRRRAQGIRPAIGPFRETTRARDHMASSPRTV